jgi:hypothetical protein
MGERGIESVDAMGHAGQIRMDGDRHDAAGLRAFAVEHIELPADHVAKLADPVAVVAHRPARNVGDRRTAAAGGRRHLLGEREEFDVGNDPERQSRVSGPAQHRPPDDRGIGKRAVGRGLHPQVLAAARLVARRLSQ